MKKQIIQLAALLMVNCLWSMINCRAQNIGINTTGAAPASTNMLEVLTPATMTSAGSTGLYVANPAAVAGAGNYGYAFQAIKTGAGLNNVASYLSATGGTNNYALLVPASGGIVGLGTITPTSTALLTINPTTNAIRNGIDMTLTGATSTATGLNITTANSNVNGITVDHGSSALTTSLYGIGGVLSSTNIVSGYNAYRNNSGYSYGLYGINGTNGAYATNASTWAAFLQGRTVISSESSPSSPLGTDLEIRNTTAGAGNPATVSLRQSISNSTSATVLANLNFGDNYQTGPQAQIQVLREAAGGAGDLPAAITFSTTPDASATLSERMRISSGGQLGLNTTSPNRMGTSTDRAFTIESTTGAHVEMMRITSTAGDDIGSLNFNRIASANGAITARSCIIGETVNGTTDSRLGFYTMGTPATLTERMTINETGNVGIGIITPTTRLHVYLTNPAMTIASSTQFVPALTANQAANLHASWNTVMPASSFNFNSDVYGAVNRIESSSSQTGTITGAYGATNDVYNSGTGTVTGAFGSANYVRNISTGTITNAYGLQANVTNAGTGIITNGYGILISSVQATNKWSLFSSDPTAPSYFAGNVGIGSTVPNARLDVKGSGSTNATYGFGVRNSSDVYSLVVADDGYVGIGTIGYFAAPQMPLHIHSTINNFHAIRLTAENTTKYWDIIKRGNTYAQPDNFVIGYWNGVSWQEEFQITPAGNFGMGVNNPTNKLEVSGNIYATGDVTLACGASLFALGGCSDIRYKKDISPLENSLTKILKLQGVKYNWKQDEFPTMSFNDRRQIGFIAQEMEKVFSEIVNTNDKGYKSIDYAKLTPVLVEAIKEQQEIIERLQSTIMTMNGLMVNQTSLINNLQTTISKQEARLKKMETLTEIKAEK